MAVKAADPQIVMALTSFVGLDGAVIIEGDLYASDHPAVKKWPDLFKPIAARTAEPRVEQATAAPGEKRGA
jgi:hypothetical protein